VQVSKWSISSLLLHWSPPTIDGVIPTELAGFRIEASETNQSEHGEWFPVAVELRTEDGCTVEVIDLEPLTQYIFRVIAISRWAESAPSESTSPISVIGHELPPPPSDVRLGECGAGWCSLHFSAPIDTGVSNLYGLVVQQQKLTSGSWDEAEVKFDAEISDRFTVTNLAADAEYRFRILSVGAEGLGPPSQCVYYRSAMSSS
jgi:hypothetical protein